MNKLKTLSDKIHCLKHNYKTCKWSYLEEDVKEFIRQLKIGRTVNPKKGEKMQSIDKLAGDKLI